MPCDLEFLQQKNRRKIIISQMEGCLGKRGRDGGREGWNRPPHQEMETYYRFWTESREKKVGMEWCGGEGEGEDDQKGQQGRRWPEKSKAVTRGTTIIILLV